jgi:hypothetical protein
LTNESAYTVFQDEGQHQKDHSAFRRWQKDNPRGYVLNFRVGKPPMLNRSLCPPHRELLRPEGQPDRHGQVLLDEPCDADGRNPRAISGVRTLRQQPLLRVSALSKGIAC